MSVPRPEIDVGPRMSDPGASSYSGLAATPKALAEDLFDFARDRIDLGHSIDRGEDATVAIIRQDRRRLTMVDFEPRLDRLRPVVGAARKLAAAANVTGLVDLGPVIAFVIAGAALLTAEASGKAIDQHGLIDLELDHVVESETTARQHFIERLRLRERPRKAVENKAVAGIRLADAVGDHVYDDAVGNELARIHDALDAEPQLAAGSGRRPQHVPGGKLGNAVGLLDTLCLGPLPRARWPEQDDVHPRRPLSFAFLIKPSYWCASRCE